MSMTQETLDLIKGAFTQPANAIDGLQGVNLSYDVKELYPVNTPLLKMIPRTVDGYSVQASWKTITGIDNVNQGSFGVAEGSRGQISGLTSATFNSKYVGLGKDGYVTYEAQMAADKFIDVLAKAKKGVLQNVVINEEKTLLAGHGTVALGLTPNAVLSTATTGGTLTAAQTISVICVALTHKAYNMVKPSVNGSVGRTVSLDNLKAVYTYTPAGETVAQNINGGAAQASTSVTITTGAGSTNSITATVTPVNGAAGYAWFWGPAGSEKIGAVTFLNANVITATATGNTIASVFAGTDHSTDGLVYDGLIAQMVKSGSNSYVKALSTGATLTSDGAGGINEIEDALASFWDNYQIVPDKLIVSAKVNKKISQLVGANGGNPLIRMNTDLNGANGMIAGMRVIGYTSSTTGKVLEILVHPEAIEGSILFYTSSVPYQTSNSGNILEISLRRDYYEMNWAIVNRTFQFGVYLDGLLKCYFPPAFGMIYNIAV